MNRLINIKEQKNLLLYLTVPYFIKSGWFSEEDWKTLRENNRRCHLEANKRIQAELYDTVHGYDSGGSSGYPLLPIIESRFLHKLKLGRVLEIGSGSGFLINRLAAQADEWVALELCPDFVARINDLRRESGGRLNHVAPMEKDILNVDFPSGSFKTVFLFYTLHHLTDRPEIIQKIWNWLEPGGFFYCLEPRHNLQRILQLVKKYFQSYRVKRDRTRHFATHDFLSKLEMHTLCQQAGFSKIVIEVFDFPWVSKLKTDGVKQIAMEEGIGKVPLVEHLGRYLFTSALK